MEVLTGHLITLFLMLVSCFLACFLPSIIHFHAEVNSRRQRILSALKRYCNCVSGGVFAGAFFTQFYPHVTSRFASLLDSKSIWIHPVQLGPTVVFFGFVLTALLERFVGVLIEKYKKKNALRNKAANAAAVDHELRGTTDIDGKRVPLISYEEDEEGSVDTDSLTLPQNEDLVLADPSKRVKKGSRNGHLGHHHHASDHSHSHAHHHHSIDFGQYQGFSRFIVLFASLGTHSIFEGLALGLLNEITVLFNMFLSILMHEILMALALGISLSQQKMQLWLKFAFSFAFAILIPVGQAIGLLIQQSPENPSAAGVIAALQLLAAGTFLHVMFMEILPQEMHGHFGLVEAFWVLFGYILIPLASLIGGDHHH